MVATYRELKTTRETTFESFIVDLLLERMQGMSPKDRADLIFLLHGRVEFPNHGFTAWN